MDDYLLDACGLVNLYCGWGSLMELRNFGATWSIGGAALQEVQFVREFDADGNIYKKRIDSAVIVAEGNIQVLSLGSAEESASLIEFASELDDGEAQALSLAKHRGRILVTDDRPAKRLAADPKIAVKTVGTPEILMAWGNSSVERRRQLPAVVRRVSFLGPFQLRTSSLHYAWWQGLLSAP